MQASLGLLNARAHSELAQNGDCGLEIYRRRAAALAFREARAADREIRTEREGISLGDSLCQRVAELGVREIVMQLANKTVGR